MLSGGEEGVLCVRRADEDSPQFIPRLQSAVNHIVTSASGKSCLSLAENALAIMDSLHAPTKPRWIRALDLPPARAKMRGRWRRLPVLQSLPGSGTVVSCNGSRVDLFDDKLGLLPPRSLTLGNKGNTVAPRNSDPRAKSSEDGQRWVLRRAAFSPDGDSIITWETRFSPLLDKHDKDLSETGVLKWFRRASLGGTDEYILDSISHDEHAADVSAVLALPQRGGLFVTASLDSTFKCWESLPVEDEGAPCWQCIASGGWRSKPIRCACASVDGTVLALALEGAVALFGPETGEDLGVLPISDNRRATQILCAVACERLLLLANLQDELMCWDLASFRVIARVSLESSLPGYGNPRLRVAEPQHAAADLRLLVFRPFSSKEAGPGDREQTNMFLWRWSWRSGSELEGFNNEVEVGVSLPPGLEILDATFLGGGLTQRILCWTSGLELWDLDFSQDGKKSSAQEQSLISKEGDVPRGQLAGVFGGRSTTAAAPAPDLLELHVRTTPAQQAGLSAKLLERIIPPSAPSHNLPPPAHIWAGVLATWGKPLDEASPGASVPSVGWTPQSDKDGLEGMSQTPATAEVAELPAWIRKVPAPTEVCRAEFVDADWVNQLVQEALVQH